MAKVETVEIETKDGKLIVNKSDDESGLFDHLKVKKSTKKKASKKKASKK